MKKIIITLLIHNIPDSTDKILSYNIYDREDIYKLVKHLASSIC